MVGKKFQEKATKMTWTVESFDPKADAETSICLVGKTGRIYIGEKELHREFVEVK